MTRLLDRLAGALALPASCPGVSAAAVTPLIPFRMLDGGMLAAPHLAQLPLPARRGGAGGLIPQGAAHVLRPKIVLHVGGRFRRRARDCRRSKTERRFLDAKSPGWIVYIAMRSV